MVLSLSSWKHHTTHTTTPTNTTTPATNNAQRPTISKPFYRHQEPELCIDAPSPRVGYHASFPQDGKLLRPPRTTRTPYWDWIHTTAPRDALMERDAPANVLGHGPDRPRRPTAEEVPEVRGTLKGEEEDDEYAFYHTHPDRIPSRNRRTSSRRSLESGSRRLSPSPPPNQRDSLLTMVDGVPDVSDKLYHSVDNYDVDDEDYEDEDDVHSFESDKTALTDLSMEIILNPGAATDGPIPTSPSDVDRVMGLNPFKMRNDDPCAQQNSPGYPLSPADSEFMKGILCLPALPTPGAESELKSGRAYSRSCPSRIILDKKCIPEHGEAAAAEVGKGRIFLRHVRKTRSRLSIFRFLS